MTLKAKLSLVFCAIVLTITLTIGAVSYNNSAQMGISDAKDTMKISASLAAKEIEGRLNDFTKMAQVSGEDPILSASDSDAVVTDRINSLASAYAFTSGNILNTKGISRKDGTSFSDRDYVKKALAGEITISELTMSKYTNKYGFSVVSPLYNANHKINGVVYYRMDIDFMSNILEQITISEHSNIYLVDGNGLVIVHPDNSLIGKYNITDKNNGISSISDKILNQKCGAGSYTEKSAMHLCGYSPIAGTDGWTVVVTAPRKDFMDATYDALKKLVIIDIIALFSTLLFSGIFSRAIGSAVHRVSKELAHLSAGNLKEPIPPSKRKDEIGQLQNSARELQQTFQKIIKETNQILKEMANYNLKQDAMESYPGSFNELSESINHIRQIMQILIQKVQQSAYSVGIGSGELANAADNLALNTVTQASSISQLAVNVEDMTARIIRNSENEAQVQERLQNLDTLIVNGNEKMNNLSMVVKQVADMSSDIQNIIKTIESIAFQINILALNASVEASHAGDSGLGFAVVAGEIGNLAIKTADSSKQTAELVTNCIKQIETVLSCADATSKCLKDIVENSAQISDAFRSISADTKAQADKSIDIKTEISNISNVVQTNTATAQETAAATQQLSEQAKSLSSLVAKFRV